MAIASKTGERRKYGRVRPVDRIKGTVGETVVFLHDVSMSGVRLVHQDPLPPVGQTCVVTLNVSGSRLTMRCTVGRSEVVKPARSQFEKALHHSALLITSLESSARRALRELIESAVSRALDEQKANAKGIPAIAAQSVQTGKGEELLRCELTARGWSRTRTRDPRQPVNGFTVSADEELANVEILCQAYEAGDSEARRLIGTMAELSISKAEGVPTRRYAP